MPIFGRRVSRIDKAVEQRDEIVQFIQEGIQEIRKYTRKDSAIFDVKSMFEPSDVDDRL